MSLFAKTFIVVLLTAVCVLPATSALAAEGGHGVHVGVGKETSTEFLDFKTDLAIYTFIVFILLVLILWKWAFGPISQALHDREDKIRKDIDDARTERLKAEELRGHYEGLLEAAEDKVRQIYTEANAKAEEMRNKRMAEADQEAQARIDKAIKEIERAKDQAIAELFEMENRRIVEATEHVLGRALSADDQNRLVNEALATFSNGQA